jgi:hypothetical protein
MRTRHALSAALIAIAALGAVTTAPAPALAQRATGSVSAKDKARAATLKTQGDDAMVTLRYDEAIAAYTKAYEITRDPALLYNRGRALQGLGQFPEALEQLEGFKSKASPSLLARVPALDSLIAEVRGKIATVTFTSNAKGARILVRSKVIGTTPLSGPIKVNSGSALVEVEAEGYLPFKETMDLPGGGELTIDAKLKLKSKMGVLTIRSPIAGARVFIDGKAAGNVPVERSVPAGTHKILVERDGYEAAETTAVVTAGDRKQITIGLEESGPIAKKWWFWTGIGVIVLGGAAVTTLLLVEKPADKGDIGTGQVSAPLRF